MVLKIVFILSIMVINNNQCASATVPVEREIRIMIFEHIPYAINQQKDGSSKPYGLDISILDHFAKNRRLKLKYVTANESFSEAFSSDVSLQHSLGSVKQES